MADNNDKLRIRLKVYDMDIPVNVQPADEPLYRDAASLITKTLTAYIERYKGIKSEKEILYMSLVEIALRYEMQLSHNDTEPYRQILSKLTSEIEEVI